MQIEAAVLRLDVVKDAQTRQLQCMGVWGGNQAVSTSLAMPGLDVWIFSRPAGGVEGGGDVHYASSCAAGALSRLLVAPIKMIRALARSYA